MKINFPIGTSNKENEPISKIKKLKINLNNSKLLV